MEEVSKLEEMMVIEINFGSRKDDIVVHFGDDPTTLAQVCNKEW